MYVKVCPLVLFIGTHLVYGSERSGFSRISAPLQHFMKAICGEHKAIRYFEIKAMGFFPATFVKKGLFLMTT